MFFQDFSRIITNNKKDNYQIESSFIFNYPFQNTTDNNTTLTKYEPSDIIETEERRHRILLFRTENLVLLKTMNCLNL